VKDFRPDIRTNLSFYRGIVEDPDRIDALNDILNELESLGLGKLVQNFSAQRDPERASDILFEIAICQLLRRHPDVQHLQYEPPGELHPPDFRFLLHGVGFDLQVKQLHNTTNELTKRLFERECRRHLSRLPKPWLINFCVADHFTRQHLNPFFAYLKRSLDRFSPATTFNSVLGEPQYRWEQDGRTLVQFSFVERRSRELGIFPGVTYVMGTASGLMARIDTEAFRKGVERLLRKARPSLRRPASPTQANLLVMQAQNILFADKTMPDALYGIEHFSVHENTGRIEGFRAPNGLFRPGQFSHICGLIFVHPEVWCFSDHFRGDYFPNPSHLRDIQYHPKPFEEMMFTILPEWRGDPHTVVEKAGE
jgi:hypothetical protein